MQKQENFADHIAGFCYDFYKKLPKRGKPQKDKEWTLLGAVILTRSDGDSYTKKVISMATGSKCIGRSKLSSTGDIIHDSHAEVLARRGMLRYLYEQLKLAYSDNNNSEIFETANNSKLCRLKCGVSFHLFSSHTACGDASIIPKNNFEDRDPPGVESVGTIAGHNHYELKAGNIVDNYIVCSQGKRGIMSVEGPHICSKVAKIQTLEENACDCLGIKVKEKINIAESTASSSQEFTKDLIASNNCYDNMQKELDCQKSLKHEFQNASVEEKTNERRESTEKSILSRTASSAPQNVTDIFRTGAKCTPGSLQDSLGDGVDYHTLGVLRTKPGRGERTLSMCCSDKMAKWNVVGCQGALISHFLEKPIYLQSIIVGRCPYSIEAMERAVIHRLRSVQTIPEGYLQHKPTLLQSKLQFEYSKDTLQQKLKSDGNSVNLVPSSAAIIWCDVKDRSLEVAVNGKKQGVTAKNINKPEARCAVSKIELFKTFWEVVNEIEDSNKPDTLRNTKLKSYLDFKMASKHYQLAWSSVLEIFNTWVKTPEAFSMFEVN